MSIIEDFGKKNTFLPFFEISMGEKKMPPSTFIVYQQLFELFFSPSILLLFFLLASSPFEEISRISLFKRKRQGGQRMRERKKEGVCKRKS